MQLPLLNIIPIKRFRAPELLDCIDIYGNEPIVITKGEVPYLVGFPVQLIGKFKELVRWDAADMPVTKSDVQRVRVFKGEDHEHGTVFVLTTHTGEPCYAFVRYGHHTTYPAVQELFRNGKLYEDYLWDYAKPFMPPREAKRTMTVRFMERGKFDLVDRKFFAKERDEIFARMGNRIDDARKKEMETAVLN